MTYLSRFVFKGAYFFHLAISPYLRWVILNGKYKYNWDLETHFYLSAISQFVYLTVAVIWANQENGSENRNIGDTDWKERSFFSFEGVLAKRYWVPSTFLHLTENQCNLALDCCISTQAGSSDSYSFAFSHS